jgi:hypothetical protein
VAQLIQLLTLHRSVLVILGLLLLLTNLFFVTTTQAAVGTITSQQHDPATIERKKDKLEGKKGTGVEMQDLLKTGEGKLGITFVDDTKVQMTENSKLVIDDFVYDPNQKDAGKLAIKVASGTARYASGQIAKNDPSKVKIKTPTATVSVRGTDFTATVGELGDSTIILLPSCPVGYKKIEECTVGVIDVETAAGIVTLTEAFSATVAAFYEKPPTPPVKLDLTESQISNILILSKPKELKEKPEEDNVIKSALDTNFLDTEQLTNKLDEEEKNRYSTALEEDLLDRDFLKNILDLINLQLVKAQERQLSVKQGDELLPDYDPDGPVRATVDGIGVTLCMETGPSDVSCVRTPTSQNSTIIQSQGSVEITNRINDTGTTTITTIQR